MIRRAVLASALIPLVFALPHAVGADATRQPPAQAGKQITAADAAPFVGEWTLALQGPNGPGTFELSVKVEKEKVSGEITSDAVPTRAIRDMSLVNKSLVLGYTFTWEGNAVDAVVSLTPADGGNMTAQIDFAGGAYVMTGAAVKKEISKPLLD
jgi:hypothetical protein